MSLVGGREFEDVCPAPRRLLDLLEYRVRREQDQVLHGRVSVRHIRRNAPRQTSSTLFVWRFFHMKCKRPSSPFWRMIAPFVGLASTKLVPSRRKQRPALKAMRGSVIACEVFRRTGYVAGTECDGGDSTRTTQDCRRRVTIARVTWPA